MGAYILECGHVFTNTHSNGGPYSEGGAYWKKDTKSNHYGDKNPYYATRCLQVELPLKMPQ